MFVDVFLVCCCNCVQCDDIVFRVIIAVFLLMNFLTHLLAIM